MPLSKARDRERKAKGRAGPRLEKLLCPPQTSKPVQPIKMYMAGVEIAPELDADGNIIPDEF